MVIGVDPTPRPIPPLAKVAVVFASLPLHAFFAVVLMSMPKVLGESFYRSLHLSWHTDLLGDQRLGGGMAWAAGEIPLVVVMIALLVQWSRSDQRTARRLDRAADRDDDAELAAYNAMLAELARRDTSRPTLSGHITRSHRRLAPICPPLSDNCSAARLSLEGGTTRTLRPGPMRRCDFVIHTQSSPQRQPSSPGIGSSVGGPS